MDGDPLTGTDIDIDLDGPLVLDSGVLVDAEDAVTIGTADDRTASDTVPEIPVGLEGDRPTTVTLPLGGGDGTTGPLSGNDVDVYLGRVIGDGRPPAADEPTGDAEPALSAPVDTGSLLSGAVGGEALSGNVVDVHLLLGAGITLPIGLAGDPGAEEEPGSGAGSADGSGEGFGDGTGASDGSGNGSGDGSGHGNDAASDCGTADGVEGGSGAGAVAADGAGTASGTGTGAAGSGLGTGGSVGNGGDPCGVGDPGVMATQSSSTGVSAIPAMAGLLALSAGLLLALGRGRLGGDRFQR